ncbi:MAG: hypothetical protein R3B96_19505 [Pirellulaceae bacterium]
MTREPRLCHRTSRRSSPGSSFTNQVLAQLALWQEPEVPARRARVAEGAGRGSRSLHLEKIGVKLTKI